jgi:hypothetical protein
VQVGTTKDFDCYERAELLPKEFPCDVSTRATMIANATHPAAEVASHCAAALAASAALLQDDNPQYASHHLLLCSLLLLLPILMHGPMHVSQIAVLPSFMAGSHNDGDGLSRLSRTWFAGMQCRP